MPEAEALIRKTETLPPALFEEAVHFIDYLSQKAQTASFAKKSPEAAVPEVERKTAKPNAVWLDETEFWG